MVKNSCFLLLFSLVSLCGFISSCSSSHEENKSPQISEPPLLFNDFIAFESIEIPDLDLKLQKHHSVKSDNFIIDGVVDKLDSTSVYWRIKDNKNKLIYQGLAFSNKKNGWWEVYYDKDLICCGNYNLGKKNGFWKYINPKEGSEKYVTYKNDTLSGLTKEYYCKDSILFSEGSYEKGFKTGYWKFYYHSGVLKEQGYFYAGYKSGWWQSFESNGNLIQEANYSKNEVSGFVKKYLNGVLFEEGKLFNGRKRGAWKSYDEIGKIKRIQEHGE